MSGVYSPPPPLPPPPPPPRPTQAGYDFFRPFVFVFDDPQWLPKIALGGLFTLLAFIVIGVPFLLGYVARLTRNVIAGNPQPLPEWTELGEFFSEGLILFCVALIYLLPVSILSIIIGIGSAITGNADQAAIRDAGTGVFGCASLVVSLITLAISLFLPAAMLMVITTRRFGAAFDVATIWAFIRANIGNYLLALVTEIIAWGLSYLGLILFCVGIIFTQFWGVVVAGYAFGQVYKNSPVKA